MKPRILIAAAATAAAVAASIPAVAVANDDDIRQGGTCTGSTSSKIKVKPDDGRIEVEFEVDQNKNGQTWKVKFKDNGEVVFRGNAVTKAPSGSFSIERKVGDASGSDSIVATAVNKSSGERCSASVTI